MFAGVNESAEDIRAVAIAPVFARLKPSMFHCWIQIAWIQIQRPRKSFKKVQNSFQMKFQMYFCNFHHQFLSDPPSLCHIWPQGDLRKLLTPFCQGCYLPRIDLARRNWHALVPSAVTCSGLPYQGHVAALISVFGVIPKARTKANATGVCQQVMH